MGNVPISCCRSKSPRSQQSSSSRGNCHNGLDGQYSSTQKDSKQVERFLSKTKQGGDSQDDSQPSHILQHISEREPDDSETDPSSNPLNHPIFASRSRSNTKSKVGDSYSSNHSQIRRQSHAPLMSSQDYGYNSTTSTNATQYGLMQDSLDSDLNGQQSRARDTLFSNDSKNLSYNRLFHSNSSDSSDVINKSPTSINGLEFASACNRESNKIHSCGSRKSSSCSTIYVDGSTISQPNLKQTMKCVSLAIYYHIKNRTSDESIEIFDESIHPIKMPVHGVDPQHELILLDQKECTLDRLSEPDQKTIYNFVKTLFKAAQLTSEYAITTLVYLERLMTYAEMDLTPRTWRRMFLGAILLSSKVWEDQAVWNVDYAQILEEISVEDINELERHFLELIQFNMNVPSSVYAKYYFHLKTLALKNGLSKEFSLLTVAQAKTLEALSRVHTTEWHSSPIHRKTLPERKSHTSLDRFNLDGRAKAVLM